MNSLQAVGLVAAIFVCVGKIAGQSECTNYKVLSTLDRAKTQPSGGSRKCDQTDLVQGWYRFMGDAGSAIANTCVQQDHCGTNSPGWMSGAHPTRAEGVVTRKVCYSYSIDCCLWFNNILVRNCGGYYVYQLVPTPYCSLRYCGNAAKACNSSSECLNGGSCHKLSNGLGYGCHCQMGYSGPQCETNVTSSVKCEKGHMQIDLYKVHFPDVDLPTVHLKSKSCKAKETRDTIRLRTSLDGCGTTYKENNKTLVFWNEVSNTGEEYKKESNRSGISRGQIIVLPFYCEYVRKGFVSTNFHASKRTVYASEGAFGNFTFTMDLYKTAQYETPYRSRDYPVVVRPNQPLWVQFDVTNTTEDLVVFAEACRATTTNSPDSFPQHVFLEDGCVRDETMVYKYNQYSTIQQFSIRSFRFVYTNTFMVYLHCELLVCHRNSTNSRCARGCLGSRKRREAADTDGSKAYDLSTGALRAESDDNKHNKQNNGESTSNSALVGGLAATGGLLALVLILFSVKMLRSRTPAHVATHQSNTTDVTVNSYEQQDVEKDEKMATTT